MLRKREGRKIKQKKRAKTYVKEVDPSEGFFSAHQQRVVARDLDFD